MTAYEVLEKEGIGAVEFVESRSSGQINLRLADTSHNGVSFFPEGEIRAALVLVLAQKVQALEAEVAELKGTGRHREKARV